MTDEKKPGEAQTPLANAAERIRGSAQWLIGAFAAVGALLAAGLQIASIGHLGTGDGARFWISFGGIGIAVIGIIIAVAAAASVSARSDVSLHWLTSNPDSEASKMVNADTALRQGITVDSLQQRLDQTATTAGAQFDRIVQLGDPGTDTTKQEQSAALRAIYTQQTLELDRLRQVRADILDVASFYRVKEAFDNAKAKMVAGALAAAVGITAFAWAANPPPSKSLDGGEVLPKTPSNVTVILTHRGIKAYGPSIQKNSKCDLSNLPAIAFAADHATYDVVTLRTDNCKILRMNITAAQGQVIPRDVSGVD